MLAVENVSIQFGARVLFSELSFTVRARERMSLAGPNGAGKSTLLKIIAGIESPDTGRVAKPKQVTVGYLPQEGVYHSGTTLFKEAETAFEDVLKLQAELREVEAQMDAIEDTGSDEYADALEVFGDLQLRLEHHDLARMKPRIETILNGLGFSQADMQKQTDTFSGGWQMRIALAKLLLREPSVLLLDEPTNHLDIETVQWLENWLNQYGGAIILISHDRAFLDNLTNRTLAFERGDVHEYSGNYSFFLRERDARKEQQVRAYKNQQREIEKAEKLINRFRAKASKARMVQSRIKQLEKVERIELEQEQTTIGFKFPQPLRSGQTVITLENIVKRYGDNLVLNGVDFEIEREERIAIVGVNGAGKSTFSRILSGVEAPTSGTRELGQKVIVSHFSQNHAEELDPKKTVLETVEAVATKQSSTNLRTLLGSFLFRGDDAFKKVSVLSGGERSRLALTRMLLQPANFLILDEPTNHLDMQSQEVLQHALSEYTGTYVIVSHNRSFLDPIVTKVLEFIPGQKPRVFHGNLSYYLDKIQEERGGTTTDSVDAALSRANVPGGGGGKSASSGAGASGSSRKEQRRQEARLRQEKARVLKPLQEKLEAVEARIAELEETKAELTKKLSDPVFFKEEAAAAKLASQNYHQAEQDLETVYSQWSTLTDEIEKAEAKFGDD